jgi:LmbE family N-acetylglucosaminyl deacetylase
VITAQFRDSFFPYVGAEIKEFIESLRLEVDPDLVLTHCREDLHQDHRLVAELSWNAFRDHLILEYEIPKYDGDLGRPNVYVPLESDVWSRKIEKLHRHFVSQRERRWFTEELFLGLMRIRGMECNAESGYAEAYYGRKMVLAS